MEKINWLEKILAFLRRRRFGWCFLAHEVTMPSKTLATFIIEKAMF